jgi:hypothetical protein
MGLPRWRLDRTRRRDDLSLRPMSARRMLLFRRKICAVVDSWGLVKGVEEYGWWTADEKSF